MRLGLVGLGRMGFNLALNMLEHGHQVVVFNRSPGKTHEAERAGATGAYSLEELAEKLAPPRLVWLMLPAGQVTEAVLGHLTPCLAPGDVLVDGGNAHYRDTLRRHRELKAQGLALADAGTSGGIEGARHGISAMVGAEEEIFRFLEPLLASISVAGGYLHTGPPGSGHFVKMVHNGIEYGMLQALGEGFELLARGPFDLNLAEVARVFGHGSVIRGWLVELLERALAREEGLAGVRGVIHSSGEGLWCLQSALELKIPTPVLAAALLARYRSEEPESLAARVVAALRQEFGGHEVERPAPGAKGP